MAIKKGGEEDQVDKEKLTKLGKNLRVYRGDFVGE